MTSLKFFTDKKVEVETAFGKFYANKIWPKKINGEPFKNTGNIIPGHGGILDRIDGMIFVFLFSYFYFLNLWKKKLQF